MLTVSNFEIPRIKFKTGFLCGKSNKKGEMLYKSGHISQVKAHCWNVAWEINAKCLRQTSVTKQAYDVSIAM